MGRKIQTWFVRQICQGLNLKSVTQNSFRVLNDASVVPLVQLNHAWNRQLPSF